MNNEEFLDQLESGVLRAAISRDDGTWEVQSEVKQRILKIFKESPLVEFSNHAEGQFRGFVDKLILEPRAFELGDQVRMVPGGSSVRRGAHVGKNVVIMPPSYINIGAYVDESSMVDSNVLVGSCAQIGKRVHLSAGVQIGGVLEPIGNMPVIIEDDAFIGGGVILVEGIHVKRGAVVSPGVVLSAAVPIYDAVHETIIKGYVPENAVVVPGGRPINTDWGLNNRLSIQCGVIIKYKNDKTAASLQLESALRKL